MTLTVPAHAHTRDTSNLPKGAQSTADCSEMEHSALWTEERKRERDDRMRDMLL